MRYNELTELAGVKKFKDMTASDILDTFGSGPIKLLGRGASGAAVQIGKQVYKFWMKDSAYQAFVEYCLQHTDNPFLPKFSSSIKKIPAFFIRYKYAPDYVHYIKMERLVDVGDAIMNKRIPMWADQHDLDSESDIDNTTLREVINSLSFMDTTDPINEFLADVGHRHQYDPKVHTVSQEVTNLLTALADVDQLKHTLDLHSGNFMIRPNGQLVIIDPITNDDDFQLNLAFSKFDNKLIRTADETKAAQSYATRIKLPLK